MILTNAAGRPVSRPTREDFENDADFVVAMHVYNQRVTNIANSAFDKAFRAAMRR